MWWLTCLLLFTSLGPTLADDVTRQMFGDQTDGLPAAFGDFDSDELTDIFVVRNDSHTLEILFGQDKEPAMLPRNVKCHFKHRITSVVPGDFNGDALMDVVVTVFDDKLPHANVILLWGAMKELKCNENILFKTVGQPLAIDYNKDMIIDLFGVDENNKRTFWVFNRTDLTPKRIFMENNTDHFKGNIRIPHSNAFLDLNDDNLADLFITTEENFEIWYGVLGEQGGFVPGKTIPLPYSRNKIHELGQTVFLDMELEGKLDYLVPVCENDNCDIALYSNNTWHYLSVNFHDASNTWSFPAEGLTMPYLETKTLRAGDFNMDGYPDIMTTLVNKNKEYRSFLLLNVPCKTTCADFSRTFEVQWNLLSPYNNSTTLGVFFDFLQDGLLEVIFVNFNFVTQTHNVSAYKNTLDFDANFVKVMVVTGLTNAEHPLVVSPLRRAPSVYGTNLPGPKITYVTTTQEGDPRMAVATQIPQSAHFSLNLPYAIFGLGRTPNFIDSLTVEMYGNDRKWTQLIPNSQMVVIPWPINEPFNWKVQLFVTPSKLIYQSVLALLATCVVISLIIAALYWKERKEDHLERLQEAHRFHFDAM